MLVQPVSWLLTHDWQCIYTIYTFLFRRGCKISVLRYYNPFNIDWTGSVSLLIFRSLFSQSYVVQICVSLFLSVPLKCRRWLISTPSLIISLGHLINVHPSLFVISTWTALRLTFHQWMTHSQPLARPSPINQRCFPPTMMGWVS